MTFRVLVSDPLAQEGLDFLQQQESVQVDVKTKLSPEELIEIIPAYDALLIRSGTQVTAEVIAAATNLKVIGRAGVGVDNVDIPAATQRGIIVMNTPDGNTISTAEHTWALVMSMARNVPMANESLRQGRWDRKKYTGTELFGKTLGIIGTGRIGSEVGKRALAFQMNVLAYDPFASEERIKQLGFSKATVEEIFKNADFITVHTPKNKETTHLLDDRAFAMMKKGVRVVNCARGGIIDEEALLRALESGKCAGAALDVFESEPPEADHPLVKHEHCITTPHLGASTEEAQVNVAVDIAKNALDALSGGEVRNAINIPSIAPELRSKLGPYIPIAEKLGMFAIQYLDEAPSQISVTYAGTLNDLDTSYLTVAVVKGALSVMMNEAVNFVNAPLIAERRKIDYIESKTSHVENFSNLITVSIKSDAREVKVSGTLFGTGDPRIIQVDSYLIEARPMGTLLLFKNLDRPGAIGQLCSIIGKHNINISDMNLSRRDPSGYAVTACNIDTDVPEDVLTDLRSTNIVEDIKVIQLG